MHSYDTDGEKGASGTTWHQGFPAHAKVIYVWLEDHSTKPKFIIDHSLGATATQILNKSWHVPGIGFAALRLRRYAGRIKNDDLCLCINRNDDNVYDLSLSLHHMGKAVKCTHYSCPFVIRHAIDHYCKAVTQQQQAGKFGKN